MAVPQAPSPDMPERRRRRLPMGLAVGTLAGAGLGAGIGLAGTGSGTVSGSGGPVAQASATAAPYGYYRAVMARYGLGATSGGVGPGMMETVAGSPMVEGYGWMTGRSGYTWMMGGSGAPEWMRGSRLPGFLTGGRGDPGSVMGLLFSDAPGPRMAAVAARRLGAAVPAGATVDRATRTVRFSSLTAHLAVLASPSMPAEGFRIAGMPNPTVVVPSGAKVTVELVNADGDMAHGLVVVAGAAGSSAMPMMADPPAFAGAAVWFLGAATSAGMHVASTTFTAATPGTYVYLCPVPGHAREGMVGRFVVSGKG